jgi:hypothetical protein
MIRIEPDRQDLALRLLLACVGLILSLVAWWRLLG